MITGALVVELEVDGEIRGGKGELGEEERW